MLDPPNIFNKLELLRDEFNLTGNLVTYKRILKFKIIEIIESIMYCAQ